MAQGRPKAGEEAEYFAMTNPKPKTEAPVGGQDAEHCIECGAHLSRDDIGLYQKLINRGAVLFACKKCTAARFHMTVEDCDRLIANFKADGCSLFF